MHTVAISFGILPLSYVRIAEDALPHTITFLDSMSPLSIIDFSICPAVDTFAMGFTIKEFAFVAVAILVAFIAFAVTQIIYPLTFVDSVFLVLHDTPTDTLAIDQLASVNCVCVTFNTKALCGFDLIVVEHSALHDVFLADTVLLPFVLILSLCKLLLLLVHLLLLLLLKELLHGCIIKVLRVTECPTDLHLLLHIIFLFCRVMSLEVVSMQEIMRRGRRFGLSLGQ
jgi:hypothetical protein